MWKNYQKQINNSAGFTLVEVMVAMVVFAIGILSLNLMQTSAIDGNASANRMTIAATWASDRVERIFALDYDDSLLDDNGTGTAGLGGLADIGANADHTDSSPDGGEYTIFWNIADDEPMPDIKTIHVIVQRNDLGLTKTITFEYMKSKYM